ncbi:MAG: flagellar export protein FliJ [Armatimonadetes bacterium]|nr:flagellar export protein FliJ [Armatimonadota bacterium]
MRRFQFRLESVLHHRTLIEGQKEQEYVKTQSSLLVLERKLSHLQQVHEEVLQGRGGAAGEHSFDIHAIMNCERYLASLVQRIESVEREVEAARIVMVEARLAMVKARQEREAVTKLRAQAHTEYLIEEQKQEQDTLDDLATLRFKRSQRVA